MGNCLFPYLRYTTLRNSLCLSIFTFFILRWIFVAIIVGFFIASYFAYDLIDKFTLPTEIILTLTLVLLNFAPALEKDKRAASITPETPEHSRFYKSERDYDSGNLILKKVEVSPCADRYMKMVLILYECSCWGGVMCVFAFVNGIHIIHELPVITLINRLLQIAIFSFDILMGTVVFYIQHIIFSFLFLVLVSFYLYLCRIFKEILIVDFFEGDFYDYLISISTVIFLSIFIHILLSGFTNWKFKRYNFQELTK